MIQLELPYPPTVNTYYRHVGNKVLISAKGREYRRTIINLLRFKLFPVLNGGVSVELMVHPPDNRKRDLDNVLKCLLDSLTFARIWGDDSQIDALAVYRLGCLKGGRIDAFIKPIP